MVKTLNRVLFVLTLSLCIGFAQDVTLTFSSDGSVSYEANQDVAGYQFDHNGCGSDAVGADDAGFMVSASGTTVIGFSMTGAALPAGSGPLLTGSSCTAADVSNIIISGVPPAGEQFGAQLDAVAVDGVAGGSYVGAVPLAGPPGLPVGCHPAPPPHPPVLPPLSAVGFGAPPPPAPPPSEVTAPVGNATDEGVPL